MSNDLDYMLLASMRKESGINILEASTFVLGLRKMAEETAPIDITGTIEGQFTVPMDQAINLMAQMVSNEFKTQAYYVYYGNMLRGTDRAGIAEEFEDHAKEELVHANYLLRRIGVLSPGGVSIPPYPPPKPLYNAQQIIREMIVVEQIGLSLWKQLHSILGDNPMKYTVEQFLQTEEAHQDELWQFLDPMAPEQQMDEAAAMPEAPKTAAEIFAAAAGRKQAAQSVLSDHNDPPGYMMVSNLKRLADQSRQLSAAVSVEDNAEPWVESKIDRASEAIDAVHDYMKYKSEKKASHALSADEMSAAGWDRSRAGKKEHSVKEAQAAQSMGKPTVPEHDELVRAGMDRRKKAMMDPKKLEAHLASIKKPVQQAAEKAFDPHALQKARVAARQLVGSGAGGMIHTASDNSEGAMDRDKVIKDKARELMAKATSGYRSLADMIHHKDQTRTEIAPMDPAALQKQQAPFVVKTNPAAVRPQDPENHTPIPMRGPLPMPKQASLGSLILKHANMIVPNPGADTPEMYVMREQQLIAQQAQGEAAHQKVISAQASQAAQQAQAEAQAAQQQLQEMQQQLQEAQQQAEQASQQQTQSAQQAAEAEARAADHSIQKMQLGMRVNQLRQSLANLVMQDPVSENSGTVSDLAATGQPATPQQQQEAEAQQQQAQQAPPSADTQQQQMEAQNAEQDAQVQEQQAQQAQAQDQAKQSAAKYASFFGGAFEGAGRSAAQGALEHAPEFGRRAAEGAMGAVADKARQYAPHMAAGGLLLGGGGLLAAHVARKNRREDLANAVAEGIRRADADPQQASPLTYAQYYSGQE